MKKTPFRVRGMDCAEETSALEAALKPIPGVADLHFDLLNGKMTVEHQEGAPSTEALMAAVQAIGMRAEPWSAGTPEAEPADWWTAHGRTALTSLSGATLLAGFVAHGFSAGFGALLRGEDKAGIPVLVRVLYIVAMVAGAWLVLPKAFGALRRLRPDMNLLMVVAIIGAATLGEWLEGATVAFLFMLSLLLESWSVGRARRAVKALLEITPPKARIIHDGSHSAAPGGCASKSCCAGKEHKGHSHTHDHKEEGHSHEAAPVGGAHEEMADVAAVAVGTRVVVKPGERIPLDGRIDKGETHVNQAPITGESLPVGKAPGDEVFAGTINGDGAIEIITTKPAGDTTLARIIRLVAEAQTKRAPSEQWVEKFARVYTPAVLVLAIAVAVIPPLLGGAWAKWIYEALALLVIACPCALVISTPVSIVAALASAARHGVLIKGGLFVETPSRIRVLALDKTGTLTMGRPSVTEVVPLSGHTIDEVVGIAAAIESRSEHPLARAISEHAVARGVSPRTVQSFQVIKGKGATALLDGRPVWIGSHRFLEERGQETPEMHATLEALSAGGASIVVLGEDDHVCGFLALKDAVRPEAVAAVASIRKAGVSRIVMLTGDNKATADAIAASTGVDEAIAELLPEDKVAAIERLKREHGGVAMVGDGVNDAPALASADLGIAMGAAGTDAAIETADVALMKDDLSRLEWLVRHSKRTLSIIRFNITLSVGVKAVFAILAICGAASLWGAIAADTGVSLLVVANALRLLR